MWKVLFKKLPDETVIDTMMPVIAETQKDAERLALFGITLVNLENEDVKAIELVSCTEIV